MSIIQRTKNFIKKYRHAWVLLYGFIYMPWFIYLEKRTDVHYFLIHSPLDDILLCHICYGLRLWLLPPDIFSLRIRQGFTALALS